MVNLLPLLVLLLARLPRFARPSDLAILHCLKVFRINQPLTAILERFQAPSFNQGPHPRRHT